MAGIFCPILFIGFFIGIFFEAIGFYKEVDDAAAAQDECNKV